MSVPVPRAWLSATIAGVLVGALAEGLWAARRATDSLIAMVATPLASLGLWLLVAPVAALGVLGLVWLRRGRRTGPFLEALCDRRRGGSPAAALALFALGIASLVRAYQPTLDLLSGRLTDPSLAAPLGVLLLVALPVALTAAGLVVHPLLARALAWSRHPAVLGLLVSTLALAWTVVGPLRRLTKDLPLAGAWTVLLAGAVAVAALLLPARLAALRGRAVVLALPALAAFGLWGYSALPTVRAALDDGHGFSTIVASGVRRAWDRDRDGSSPVLGGGDCDDEDPWVSSEGFDVPGDGRDEDCSGTDREPVPPVSPQLEVFAPVPEAFRGPWNVLVLTIDALRPDRMSLYGHSRPTTPNLERLATNGLVFTRAYAPANATRYSLPAVFAGGYLGELTADWVGAGYLEVYDDRPTIFDRLDKAGWYTEAALPAQQRDGMWFGLEAGFDVYAGVRDARLRTLSAAPLAARAEALFNRVTQTGIHAPWALWMHYTEPHEPYRRHAAFDFGDGRLDRYDSEIAAVDAAIGKLMGRLQALSLADHTIVVITSDHGEEFGEHGRSFHGHQLFDESVRVPFLIHVPGAPAVRIESPVSTIDLAPTLANLAGLTPSPTQSGTSHVGALFGGEVPDPRRVVFTECIRDPARLRTREVALIRWPYKAMLDLERRRERLFDLAEDPGERHDLGGEAPPEGRALLDELAATAHAHEDQHLEGMRRRDVSPPGRAVLRGPPRTLEDAGLVLLGQDIRDARPDGRSALSVKTWFQPVGDARPNLTFQIEAVDAAGRRVKTFDHQPFAGLYGSHRWSTGEVIRVRHYLRFTTPPGRVRLRLRLLEQGRLVSGPVDLGEVVYNDAAAPG